MAVLLIVGSLLLSYIPCLLLYFWLKKGAEDQERQDLYRKLLKGGILCSLGAFACSGAMVAIKLILGFTILPSLVKNDLVEAVYQNFLVFAFSEELVKGLTAWRIVKRNLKEFSWLDLIVAVAIVGIGFEMIETVIYLIESNPIQIIVRGLTALHAVYGMVMGYFLGKSLRTGSKASLACAFLVPVLLHGLYDFSLNDELQALNDNLVFLPFIIIFITMGMGIWFILKIRTIRRTQDEEYLAPLPVNE